MLAIRPVTYEVETSLSPKRVLRKLDGDLIEHRPTINILSQSKFMKNHRDDTIFYGYRTDADSFQIFHHTAKKRDGGSTGFYGKVEKTPNQDIRQVQKACLRLCCGRHMDGACAFPHPYACGTGRENRRGMLCRNMARGIVTHVLGQQEEVRQSLSRQLPACRQQNRRKRRIIFININPKKRK